MQHLIRTRVMNGREFAYFPRVVVESVSEAFLRRNVVALGFETRKDLAVLLTDWARETDLDVRAGAREVVVSRPVTGPAERSTLRPFGRP